MLSLTISLDTRNVDRVCDKIKDYLDSIGRDDAYFDIMLVSREALCNSMFHATDPDGPGWVKYTLVTDDLGATIEVEDNGPGWSWKDHDWNLPGIDEISGRGLFIIRHYSDSVEFNDTGNKIIIRKIWSVKERA